MICFFWDTLYCNRFVIFHLFWIFPIFPMLLCIWDHTRPYRTVVQNSKLSSIFPNFLIITYFLFWKKLSQIFNFFFIQCFLLSRSCKITHQDCQSCLRHKRIRQFRLIQKVSIYFYLVSVSKWVFIRQILRSRSYPKKLISSHTVCLSVNLHLLRCWCI